MDQGVITLLVQQTQQTKLAFAGSSNSKTTTRKKLDTQVLKNTEDPRYMTDEESDDDRKGGRKTFPLLLRLLKPCQTMEGEGTHRRSHNKGQANVEASSLVPDESEWETWA